MGQFALNSPTTMFRVASSLFGHDDSDDEPSPGAVDTLAANTGLITPQRTLVPANTGKASARQAPAPADTVAAASQSTSIDAYKAEVAHHVVDKNRDQTFSGKLPEMLPAIVVLRITVDKNGNITDVDVQRYRDTEAAWVAVTSMRMSDPLPRPVKLLATDTGKLTFSETFLFDADYRFQLRSLAGPQ
jgi:protein TonB